jgi:tripartite-type tricarboxylate transporter receptor subunit TctC
VGDFCVQIINAATGAGITMVPFKGAAPAITALRGGHIEGVVLALGALGNHFKSGAMRGLVSSSRFPEFADIPTMTELGYQQDLLGVWLAFFASGGVGPQVTGALVPAIEQSVRNPAIAAKLAPLGILQQYAPPEAVRAEIRDEYRRVGELARKAGLAR